MKLIDVAKRAGVSKTTVSAILNQDMGSSYREDTVLRVLECAKAVGYRPNLAASLLRSKRTHMIGIFADHTRSGCARLQTQALVEELKKQSVFRPMFVDSNVLQEDVGSAFGFEFLEGLFWSLPPRFDGLLEAVLARPAGRPEIVTIGHQVLKDAAVSSVLVGLGDGAYQATEYLLKLGHRRIALIYRAPATESPRFDGYKRALRAHRIKLDSSLCMAMPDEYQEDSYFRTGWQLTRELYARTEPMPTAILCHNDEVAIGVIQAAYQLSLKIPDDLSVVGYDGLALADYTVPTLTTVVQPIRKNAETAVELMISRIDNRGSNDGVCRKLSCEFRVGQSTTFPRRG